ncbi:MAG: hypothetical protein QM739_18895 [Propionivibrio sp.]
MQKKVVSGKLAEQTTTDRTTCEAVRWSTNAVSVSLLLKGLRKSVNDLSCGALVYDTVFTIALPAIQDWAIAAG